MLILRRMQWPNEMMNCDATGKTLIYGDFYYEDNETGKIIDANFYHKQLEDRKAEQFDYSELENAKNQFEYEKELRKAERELLANSILDDYERFTY